MKHKIKTKATIEFTLDSSETIMFTKGGRHSVAFKQLDDDEDESTNAPNFKHLAQYDEIEITFQLERNQQERFDFITNSYHPKRDENENKSA